MHELIYAMRFTGQADASPRSDGNVLKAATTAPSSTLTTTVGPDGLTSALHPADGGEATFTSEVTFTERDQFPGSRHDRLRRGPSPALLDGRGRLPGGQCRPYAQARHGDVASRRRRRTVRGGERA